MSIGFPAQLAAGATLLDALVAASAVVSVLIAVIALMESRRALRVANVEAYPVAVEKAVFLGMQLRNFGPRYAKDVRWEVWIRSPKGERKFHQSLRMPILATGDAREVLLGVDPTNREKRTLLALADAGGTLVSSWSWRDGQRFAFFERHHKEQLEVPLPEILADFARALQREPDETLAALAAIRAAIDGVARSTAAPATAIIPGPKPSLWKTLVDFVTRRAP